MIQGVVEYFKPKFKNREHAALLLAQKLSAFKNSGAVIAAIPKGGLPVASVLAQQLNLSLTVTPCAQIKHPAITGQTIGSVSVDEVLCHDFENLPGDYLYHQIRSLQLRLQTEYRHYMEKNVSLGFKNKDVIVVDDRLKTGDTMLACIRSIQKQKPSRIIIAVPVVTHQAIKKLSSEASEFIYLYACTLTKEADQYWESLPRVSDGEANRILETII